MPKMPKMNVFNSMVCIYPVCILLCSDGMAQKAKELFLAYVFNVFHECFGKDSTTYFLFIHKPMLIYLQLLEDEQNGKTRSKEQLLEFEEWVLTKDVGVYSAIQIKSMCPMGKDAHCVIAEICWLLLKLKTKGSFLHLDELGGRQLYEKGLQQATKSIACTKNDKGLEYARRYQSERVLKKYISLGGLYLL